MFALSFGVRRHAGQDALRVAAAHLLGRCSPRFWFHFSWTDVARWALNPRIGRGTPTTMVLDCGRHERQESTLRALVIEFRHCALAFKTVAQAGENLATCGNPHLHYHKPLLMTRRREGADARISGIVDLATWRRVIHSLDFDAAVRTRPSRPPDIESVESR